MPKSVTIIGAGIVGLATALKLKQKDASLLVRIVEKEKTVAAHQTGHNSGVIHSGIYYRPGSLKAKNCKKGYDELLAFCEKEGIQYDICGKIIVATNEAEIPIMESILDKGKANGLEGLRIVEQDELKEIEPHINGRKGIVVPQTGIIDFKGVAKKYKEKILDLGGEIILGEKVVDVHKSKNQIEAITPDQTLSSDLIINCSGLYSDKVAQLTRDSVNYKILPFRGEYYKIKKEKQYLVNNLIYPVPNPNFPVLGVHFTRMINGGIEAGPNAVLAFRREGYEKLDIHFVELFETLFYKGFIQIFKKYWREGFTEFYRSWSKAAFVSALQKLIPEITKEDLIPGGAGVRAQAADTKGNLIDDFLILEEDQAINVINAPSPAATASLAVGGHVAELALKHL